MTRTLPEPVRVARFTSTSSDAGTGAARMGRTREKKANRIKVSLYIVKRRLCKATKVPGGFLRKNGKWSAGEEEGRVRLTRNGDSSKGRFYTWRGPLHDVNPRRRRRGRRCASLYRRIAQGGAKQLCNSDEARRKRGNDKMTRAMPYSKSRMKIKKGWGGSV